MFSVLGHTLMLLGQALIVLDAYSNWIE